MTVVAGTLDQTGTLALEEFVKRFHPEFLIGAIDGNKIAEFGDWGERKTFVPQLYFIDKTGVIRRQFHGSDPIFAGQLASDQIASLRSEIHSVYGASVAMPVTAAPVVKPTSAKPGIVIKK